MRDRWMPKKISEYLTAGGVESSLEQVEEAYASGSQEDRQRYIQELAAHRLPFEEYVRELAVLGLRNREYSTEDYAVALGDRIGRRVEISRLSEAEYSLGSYSAADAGDSFGRLVFVPGAPEIQVEIPVGLSPWLHRFTVGHELGHLAAAHPPRIFTVASGAGLADSNIDIESPPVRLARRPPLLEGDLPRAALETLYEEEADLRAQYAIITGNLGPTVAQTSKLSQIS